MRHKISQREAVRNRKELRLLKDKLDDVASAWPNSVKIAAVTLSPGCAEVLGKLKAARLLGRFLTAVAQNDGTVDFFAIQKVKP